VLDVDPRQRLLEVGLYDLPDAHRLVHEVSICGWVGRGDDCMLESVGYYTNAYTL